MLGNDSDIVAKLSRDVVLLTNDRGFISPLWLTSSKIYPARADHHISDWFGRKVALI